MPDIDSYSPITHNHQDFLAKASKRRGFTKAYNDLEVEYSIAKQLLEARHHSGLTQEAVAKRMGTTKSAVSRLESTGKHTPSVASLKKYASAVGCNLEVRLVPQSGT